MYSQFRKNYLSDMIKLIETYFPPLKVVMIDPLQITNYDLKLGKEDLKGGKKYSKLKVSQSNKINDKEAYIIDIGKDIIYPVRKIKGILNVFDIAKAAKPHIGYEYCSIIGLTNEPIYDTPPKENSFILGRAWGRVWIASMDSTTREESYKTIVHELMHTFALGHCEKWNCIMNWMSLDDHCSHLCLPDLIKMQHFFGFDIKERYLSLAKLYKNVLKWEKDYEWIKSAIEKMENSTD